jgi:phosphoglycerate-specific signal transduction histidine kinase
MLKIKMSAGHGITKENLPYVNDPFFTTKKRTLNFGLGLSYCYNVMQKHKGDLTIQSEKDKVTTITPFFMRVIWRSLSPKLLAASDLVTSPSM